MSRERIDGRKSDLIVTLIQVEERTEGGRKEGRSQTQFQTRGRKRKKGVFFCRRPSDRYRPPQLMILKGLSPPTPSVLLSFFVDPLPRLAYLKTSALFSKGHLRGKGGFWFLDLFWTEWSGLSWDGVRLILVLGNIFSLVLGMPLEWT